jgi:hypothetical protein
MNKYSELTSLKTPGLPFRSGLTNLLTTIKTVEIENEKPQKTPANASQSSALDGALSTQSQSKQIPFFCQLG